MTVFSPIANEAHPIRVLVVEDHPLLATAIAGILESQEDLSVCGIAHTGAEGAAMASRDYPSVVLIDCRLPDVGGPAAAASIKLAVPATAVVFHSADEDETSLLDAIDVGALAYLTKSATAGQIIEAVRKASAGEVLIPVGLFAKALARQRELVRDAKASDALRQQFTPRELDVLGLLARGFDTVTLSNTLGIAPHTVEWHVQHVIEKLAVHSKLQAVIAGVRMGLIDLA